ncbi:hypothetical protein PISMIDRAFT_18983 [Pisolithus microcarpus 441]|uniref:Uncharacterized protein n=1 Tax=Pisolithus microcarpus 441 TaxID=765257 RepID=A0A0C9Y4Z9_9AGAM|nr:hypothetical protein PISMIDRAFT_18983 [Pisolithus microcarpus 441]
MPAIVNLTDKTAHLVRGTPYNKLHRQISHLERELKDTLHNLRCALCKVDDLRHAPHTPTPTIPAPTMGGGVYDYNQEAGSSRVAPPPAAPPSSSSQGRAQAKPVSQVVPGYDFMVTEDEITSTQIYDDIPMVIKTTTQGTLFPEFTGHVMPVLCPGCSLTPSATPTPLDPFPSTPDQLLPLPDNNRHTYPMADTAADQNTVSILWH